MNTVPFQIGGARVLAYTALDDRHTPTGATQHLIAGQLAAPPKGLAICQHEGEDGFYLFGCDQDWEPVTDTWHATLDEAEAQAEFEHRGTSETWKKPTASSD